jgi:hypothetical protein
MRVTLPQRSHRVTEPGDDFATCRRSQPARPIERGAKMLNDGRVAARLPVRDLEKARAFYSEKL